MKIHWHVLSYIFGLDLYNSSITNLKESTHLTIDYLKLGFFSVTYRSTLHKKRNRSKKVQSEHVYFYSRDAEWTEEKIATEPCNWDTSWISGGQRITSFSSMTSLSDGAVIQCSLQFLSALFLTFADCLRGALMLCCQLVVNPQFLTRKRP